MAHDLDPPTDGVSAVTDPPAGPRPEARPDFLDRARRILSGDIRPDDYLAVVPEVAACVEDELRHIREREGFDASAEFRSRLVNEWTLQYHHGCQTVACRRTAVGVIVFAAGAANIRRLYDHFPNPDQRPDVFVTTPAPWQPLSPTDSQNL